MSLDTSLIDGFPQDDRSWTEDQWRLLIEFLVKNNIVKYRELASLVLGHLNPSQVGTSVASKPNFQAHYEKGKCWAAVRQWHFDQSGKCADCGTRLELQADHIIPKEEIGAVKADRLDNLTLRCRRCNVIKRPSHKQGGKTFLTAEAALMWILFTHRPDTYQEFNDLCRSYGLTMANIRFEESWAMAIWLNRIGLYDIAPDSKYK